MYAAQVATEWLFSVPEHVLERHLAPDPNTPTGEADGGEAARVLLPRRVPLQVGSRGVLEGAVVPKRLPVRI